MDPYSISEYESWCITRLEHLQIMQSHQHLDALVLPYTVDQLVRLLHLVILVIVDEGDVCWKERQILSHTMYLYFFPAYFTLINNEEYEKKDKTDMLFEKIKKYQVQSRRLNDGV